MSSFFLKGKPKPDRKRKVISIVIYVKNAIIVISIHFYSLRHRKKENLSQNLPMTKRKHHCLLNQSTATTTKKLIAMMNKK